MPNYIVVEQHEGRIAFPNVYLAQAETEQELLGRFVDSPYLYNVFSLSEPSPQNGPNASGGIMMKHLQHARPTTMFSMEATELLNRLRGLGPDYIDACRLDINLKFMRLKQAELRGDQDDSV